MKHLWASNCWEFCGLEDEKGFQSPPPACLTTPFPTCTSSGFLLQWKQRMGEAVTRQWWWGLPRCVCFLYHHVQCWAAAPEGVSEICCIMHTHTNIHKSVCLCVQILEITTNSMVRACIHSLVHSRIHTYDHPSITTPPPLLLLQPPYERSVKLFVHFTYFSTTTMRCHHRLIMFFHPSTPHTHQMTTVVVLPQHWNNDFFDSSVLFLYSVGGNCLESTK